jgi:hypothetical protein
MIISSLSVRKLIFPKLMLVDFLILKVGVQLTVAALFDSMKRRFRQILMQIKELFCII